MGLVLCAPALEAQVLVKEVVSREVTINVGGLDKAGGGQPVSRAVSVFVDSGPGPEKAMAVSREVTLAVNASAAPPPVTNVAVQVSPTGDAATLDWSGYNQWAVRDIAHFAIYFTDAAGFTDVTGMTPHLIVPGESTSVTLLGLAPWTDHYFAVVAVDVLGNFIPQVSYAAAYVLSPQVISREVTFFVGGEAPVPGRQAISREISLAVMRATPPPAVTGLTATLSPTGETATLDWSGYNQAAVGTVARFDIYLSDTGPIGDVTGLTPLMSVSGEINGMVINGLEPLRDHYFAVVPVDGLGNFQSAVQYAAGYVISPQLISREISVFIGGDPPDQGRQAISREITVVVPDATVPAPVTGVGSGFTVATSTTDFGALLLDWSSYNELLQHDVVRYRVYVSDAFFDQVGGMEPFAYLPAENPRQTLKGLSGLGIYHVAVVAEDVQGGFNPNVRSFSAQASVAGVGEAQNLAVTSGPDSLTFAWEPPGDAGGFLNGYRVYFGGSASPVELPAHATSFNATGLERARGYPFRITTVDLFGGESGGTSVFAATWLHNPSNVALTTLGDEVLMTWDAAQPAALVRYYAVYASDQPFTSVTGMTPAFIRMGTSAVLGGFADAANRCFAVTAVNASDAADPAVQTVRATKQLQTIDFPPLTAGPAIIPLTATASSGLPVVFSSNAPLIGSVAGATLVAKQGGLVTVTARQAGNADYWPVSASQTLRLPPVIASFTADGADIVPGLVLRQAAAELRVVARDASGIAQAAFFGRVPGAEEWMALGTDNTPSNGLTAVLPISNLPFGLYELRTVLTAASGGFTSERLQSVMLDLQPVLTLTIGSEVEEGGTMEGTVSIQRARPADLVVTLTSANPTQLDAGVPVTIVAGQTSAPVAVYGRQDHVIEAPLSVKVTASSPGAIAAQKTITVADDDWPLLTLTLDRTQVAESAGSHAAVGRVTRSVVSPLPLTVWLTNSNPGAATVPASVVIPGGVASVEFPVGVIDNALADGAKSVVLRGEIRLSGAGAVVQSPTATLTVTDDEGATLELAFSAGYLLEGQSGIVRVRRVRGSNTPALSVALSSNAPASVQVPATVSIPAGASEVTFNAAAPLDVLSAGNRSVRLTATATNYSPAQLALIVTDLSLPDLVVVQATAPALIATEAAFDVSYRVENRGASAAAAPLMQRVMLSRDPMIGDDILLAQTSFTGGLGAGSHFQRVEAVRAPRAAGTYWLIVITDAGESVDEILESNNTLVVAAPLVVEEAYTAVVQTEAALVPANTPIIFTGSAMRGIVKQPNALVSIHIKVAGTHRTINALTNASGDFTTTWQPLPGEGGDYEIGASHPGTPDAPVQDTFAILTLRPDFPQNPVTMDEASSVSFDGVLINPTGHALTGLAVQGWNLPAGLTIQTALPGTTLPAGEVMDVSVAVTAAAGVFGTHVLTLRTTTAEGIAVDAPVTVSVRTLLPRIVASPAPLLQRSVVRGTQKTVNVTLENQGAASTGSIHVFLPNVPWMEMASATPLPAIAPGAAASFSILLKPGPAEALTQFTGNVVVAPATGPPVHLPFAIRVVSDRLGTLVTEVVDEAFYFSEGSPKVAGARVTVRDAITAEEIATQVTPADGRVTFANLTEGWYAVEAGSPDHASWRGNVFVNAADSTLQQVFISREMVKYTWSVEEIEVNDRYRITIESTFETNVPAPVLTVTPPVLDVEDLTEVGQSKVINFIIDNHGFIAANKTRFRFDQHPFYQVTPLIEDIGTIPAKSSIVIPVTVRRVGTFASDGSVMSLAPGGHAALARPLSGGGAPCGFGGSVQWSYDCGKESVGKSTSVPASGASGDCTGGYPIGSGLIIGAGAGNGGFATTSFATGNSTCLDPCYAKAALDCIIGYTPAGCPWAAANCAMSPDAWTCGSGLFCAAGPGANTIICVLSFIKCYMDSGGSAGGGTASHDGFGMMAADDGTEPGLGEPWLDLMDQSARLFEPKIARAVRRVEAHLDYASVLFGSRARVVRQTDAQVAGWYDELKAAMEDGSDGGRFISGAEQNALASSAASRGLSYAEFAPVVARFNRTFDYANRGILTEAAAPEGESLDFVPWDRLQEAAVGVMIAHEQSQADGFADPRAELAAALAAAEKKLRSGQGGVCARVKIRIDQEAVMTRSAFRASLELTNNRPDAELKQVGFDLRVLDLTGGDASDKFNVRVTSLTNLAAIDGTGEIPPSSAGGAQWTLIPRDTAAPSADTVYMLGGTISYLQAGTLLSIPVAPVRITVRPDAALHLKYFHQRDVFSDDPHTNVIEPAVPYHLAVMVENRGAGAARNLTITSGQPEIIENEKGLLIDFNIIGSRVAGQERSPSLKADFGNVLPNQRHIATWDIVSSLQGLFVSYEATFQHLDSFGDERISLIKDVEIHEMIHMIEAPGTLADGLPDFLVNDVADIDDLPDTVHLSNGTTAPVAAVETGTWSGPVTLANPVVTLATGQGSGWSYLRIASPAPAGMQLASVQRSDGVTIPLGVNVWMTDRTFIGLGRRPIYENMLHLADFNSTGQYTLTYQAIPADTEPPVSSVQSLPAQSPWIIPVRWSGQDDRGLAFFDIYASINGGPFSVWLPATQRISSLYLGEAGNTYAFYSRATDTSGNTEPAPVAAQAVTTVSVQNQAPVLEPIDDVVVDERTTLRLLPMAWDSDAPAWQLRYTLQAASNALTINAETGEVVWETTENDGSRVIPATVTVTDSGSPPLSVSRDFVITVAETNEAPVIGPVPPQSVTAGTPLQLAMSASDADLPAQTLAFSLGGTPPSGMSISGSGLLAWTPDAAMDTQTLDIEVQVTDNGAPPRSASMQVPITVVAAPAAAEMPVVATLAVSDEAATSARVSGEVTDQGGSDVTERGVVVSLFPTPTTNSGIKVRTGAGAGSFAAYLVGLTPGTTYFVRAYAANSGGTAYGAQLSFITLPDVPGVRRVLYLKPGGPGPWTTPGLPGSQSIEIAQWIAAGFEVAVGDAMETRLTATMLSHYRVVRLFSGFGELDFPDAWAAALAEWAAEGGTAVVESAYSRGINAVRRFGVERIDGQNGGSDGLAWHHRGTPALLASVAAPFTAAKVGYAKMDRPVLAKGHKLLTAARVGAYPAIVHGPHGLGQVVIHFIDEWSQDAAAPANAYRAAITEGGNLTYLTKLIDYAGRPTRWDAELPLQAMVGEPVSIELGGGWTILSVAGLPGGLKFDRTTNTIVGSATASGVFKVRVTVRDPNGISKIEQFVLRIKPLPASAVGSFVATCGRELILNGELGGTLNCTNTAAGAVTGKIVLGAATHAFKGKLVTDGTTIVRLTTTILRTGRSALALDLSFLPDNRIAGTVKDGAAEASIDGWRQTWHAKNPVSAGRVGAVNAHLALLAPSIGDPAVPQGTSFATIAISAAGVMNWSAKLSDGTAATFSGVLGPVGQWHFWKPLYANTGSILAAGNLNPAGGLTGSAGWVKRLQTKVTERNYRAGFGFDLVNSPVMLEMQGSRWNKPPAPIVLGSPAQLTFTSGGVGSSAGPSPNLAVVIGPNYKVTAGKAGSLANPAFVALAIAPATGLISGSFRLMDDNPERPGTVLSRNVTFQGLVAPHLNRGAGFFLLPQLADPPNPKASTTPILSGQVQLQ